MTNYNEALSKEYGVIRDKVRRGMLPLVARNPAIDKAVSEYALAQADYYHARRSGAIEAGKSPDLVPIAFHDSDALDRYADLVMHEELTWSHADKMSIVEFPIMSGDQEKLRRGKYTPNSDLQYGGRHHNGRRKTSFTDDLGAPQVRNHRMADPYDPVIDGIGEHAELYDALDNAGLTARQREAVDLVYFGNEGDGMTQKDAAVVMGVSQQAVAKFERAAISKIGEYMTKD